MEKIIVKDFETALDALILTSQKDFNFDNVEFENNAQLSIKIEGDQWDGAIDYKIAELILKLQKDYVNAYNIITSSNHRFDAKFLEENNIKIVYTVEKGCSKIVANILDAVLPEAAKEAVKKMTGKQITFTLCFALASYGGTAVANKYLDNSRQAHTEDTTIQIIEQTALAIQKSNSAMHYLATQMDSKDFVTRNEEQKLSAKEALEKYMPIEEPQTEGTKYLFNIDNLYKIETIHLNNSTVKIRFGRKLVVFSLGNLNNQQREDFYKACATADSKKGNTPINLQVTATFQNGSIIDGFIVGIGTKRQDAISYEDAIAKILE